MVKPYVFFLHAFHDVIKVTNFDTVLASTGKSFTIVC
jgi:hypothetical protein